MRALGCVALQQICQRPSSIFD